MMTIPMKLESLSLIRGMQLLRDANVDRRGVWHDQNTEQWTGADWSNEMGGEAGEAMDAVKKLRRIETGVVQRGPRSTDQLLVLLGEELADVVITADLVAAHYELTDLGALVIAKFNAVSEKRGLPQRL